VIRDLCLGAALVAAVPAAAVTPRATLAREILADRDLTRVRAEALALLAKGFNAGDGYPQVWIRDLNTFIELQLAVYDRAKIRRALVAFARLQQPNGEIVDGYVQAGHVTWDDPHRYGSPHARDLVGFKNTVETDQESSLIQAVARYVRRTGDRTILAERIGGRTMLRRLGDAIAWLRRDRWSARYGLLKGATTHDWGDVQVEGGAITDLDASSHWSVDIYDNAMFVIALRDMALLDPARAADWRGQADRVARAARARLWDARRGKFAAHLYLAGSPFRANFDEGAVEVHGGTAVAIQAGLLTPAEIRAVAARQRRNRAAAGAASIGLTLYPPYPADAVPGSRVNTPYRYQNGGDWTWFGGRMVQALVANGDAGTAYAALKPMIARTIRDRGFYEWYTVANAPEGSAAFKGSAGVLVTAIDALRDWARAELRTR